MGKPVQYAIRDAVAYVAMCAPPANALDRDMRAALINALARANADEAVRLVVILGEGKSFSAGADLRELERPSQAPTASDLCRAIVRSAKPVVAALHGAALGSGCALALAAHYRVALKGTRLGFPEIKMGLLPQAGGTQLLPRYLGAKGALDLLMSGRAIEIESAPGQMLVDGVGESDLLKLAATFCARLDASGATPKPADARREGFRNALAYQTVIADAYKVAEAKPELVATEIVRAVEAAALLPFEAGLAFEEDAFEQCRTNPQSLALRSYLLAERKVSAFPEIAPDEMQRFGKLAVLGGGPLAPQLVYAALRARFEVHWGARDLDRLKDGLNWLRGQLRAAHQDGVLNAAQVAELQTRLHVSESTEAVKDCDVALVAAQGQHGVAVPEGVVKIIAMPRPVNEVGLRFGTPMSRSRLAEVQIGPKCTRADRAAAVGLARQLGKVPVQVIAHEQTASWRLSAAMHRAADALVDLGASPYEIDAALPAWGWARPPFLTRDIIGLRELASAPRAEGAENWSARFVEAGRLGRAEKAGFYDWSSGAPTSASKTLEIVDLVRPAAELAPEMIVRLMLGAVANEGARLVSEGVLAGAAEVDVISVLALEFPKWRGGVMHAASEEGLFSVVRALKAVEHADVDLWTPLPVWTELSKNGLKFNALAELLAVA